MPLATITPNVGDPSHAEFASLLPVVERHARIAFRHVKCRGRREDAVAEAVALAWKWFVRLRQRGRDANTFPLTLAGFAARAVRCGRRLCGQEAARDALSPLAQRRRGFRTTLLGEALDEALTDNTRTPVPEQVCFRHDFPLWLSTLSERDQALALDLMKGERTLDVAARHGVSQGRVSQLRREFLEGWRRFCNGENGSRRTPDQKCHTSVGSEP